MLITYEYPIGHPELLNESLDTNVDQYFGFIKCIVIPPRDLAIPVLPVRDQQKLLFPLCGQCAVTRHNYCDHKDDERKIVGTWTSMEVQKAVKKGYKIKKIIEVLHYPIKSTDIFKKYIQTFLKIKTESSDWPADCDTEDKRTDFIREFKEKEGK